MPKQRRFIQRKLKFDTYHAHYALGPDPEIERQQKREAHLKDIHRRLEEAQITYEPKGLKKKEKIIFTENFKNGKYCPWGDLPEMYPGQHKGKSPEYGGTLLRFEGKDITEIYDTATEEQQHQMYENLKTYIGLHGDDAIWEIPQNVKELWKRISEK